MEREDIVKYYFHAWLYKRVDLLKGIFSENITYSECFGPEYHGLAQVIQWFVEWNTKGTVLRWEIKRFIHQDRFTVVEWYFECKYDNDLSRFDGVSIIEFDECRKIVSLKEFQSKAEHYFPYGEDNFLK